MFEMYQDQNPHQFQISPSKLEPSIPGPSPANTTGVRNICLFVFGVTFLYENDADIDQIWI